MAGGLRFQFGAGTRFRFRRRPHSRPAERQELRTEFSFVLPRGYVDQDGTVHKSGVMRLATARDELLPLYDARVQENDTLRVTTDSVMVYRGGTFNPSTGWTALQGETRTVTLRTGVKVHLGSLTLPEGNVTLVRVKIVGATIERGSNGVLEDIGTQSGQFDITTHTRVNAQTTTNVLVGFHIACPATANGSSSGHSECIVTPSAKNED